jgi:hypothetical protein
MRRPAAIVGSVLLLTLGACQPPDTASEAASETAPDFGPGTSEPLAADVGDAAASGGVPADLLRAIIADLAQREQLRPADISLLRGEPATWPDGALGCPRPGEIYTHAEVPGYWVVLQSAGQEYAYRAAAAGHFRRCDGPPVSRAPVE